MFESDELITVSACVIISLIDLLLALFEVLIFVEKVIDVCTFDGKAAGSMTDEIVELEIEIISLSFSLFFSSLINFDGDGLL